MANKNFIVKNGLDVGGLITGTTTTQSASDNSTKLASTAYVTTAVSNLVDGAPSTLNTLNEIAAALNDDAALNTTLTNSIATKLPLAGGTMTGVLKINDGDDSLPTLASSTKAVFATDNTANFESSISIIGATNNGSAIINFGDYANEDAGQIKYKNENGGSDYMSFTSNTSEAMRILHNGNIGINSTAPGAQLQVDYTASSLTDATGLLVYNTSGSQGNRHGISLQSASGIDCGIGFYAGTTAKWAISYDNAEAGLHIYDETNDEKVLTARAGGLIGIGTNNPDVELHVQRTTTSASYNYATRYVAAFERNGACDVAIRGNSSSSSSLSFSDEADADVGRILYDHSDNSMQFKANASEHMRIASDGKVSIGTTTTDRELKVQKAGDHSIIAVVSGTSNLAGMVMGDTSDDDVGHILYNNSTNTMGLQTNSGHAMTIGGNSGNDMHIFNTSDDCRIRAGSYGSEFDSNPNLNHNIRFHSTAGILINSGRSTGSFVYERQGTEVFRINHLGRQVYNASAGGNAHGNFVGEVGSGYKSLSFERTVGGGEVGSVVANTSSTTYNTSSDYRLKEHVNYTWDATTRLKQLKPIQFQWIADDSGSSVDGFLAHEVSPIVPEAVTGEKDATVTVDDVANGYSGNVGDPIHQGIDHSKLVPLLVKTIQELEARIATLEG